MSKAIALVPARGGSKRVVGKNKRLLAGHPLIAYTICAALDSGVFEKVLVSSDSTEILSVAARYGADCLRRPDDLATDTSPDIGWLRHALEVYEPGKATLYGPPIGAVYDTFSILRPTSPFRKPETIRRAFKQWEEGNSHPEYALWADRLVSEKEYEEYQKANSEPVYSSLRAVEPTTVHPAKCWQVRGGQLVPVLMQPDSPPWHDSQYASLPKVYAQNASLEIAWVKTVLDTGTISGPKVMPFFTVGDEGFDLNNEYDWQVAELMLANGDAKLPEVRERVNA